MSGLPEFRVYLSSTIDDMVEERAAAWKIIAEYGVIDHSYRASEEGTIKTCTTDVRRSQLYVGLIGHRHGWVPKDARLNQAEKSITQLEYESCRAPGKTPIARLLFVRTQSKDKWRDSEQPGNDGSKIKAFRAQLAEGDLEQTFQFETVADLGLQLDRAVNRARQAYHRRLSPGGTHLGSEREWARRLKPVVVLRLQGSDDAQAAALESTRPQHFSVHAISPAAELFVPLAEEAIGRGQLTVLMVSRASLQRATGAAESPRFERLLQMLKWRGGGGAIIGLDLKHSDLPTTWRDVPFVALKNAGLTAQRDATVSALFTQLQSLAPDPPDTDVRLALPCLVIAPTLSEMQALSAAGGAGFAGFPLAIATQRAKQFEQFAKAAAQAAPGWPTTSYGPRREDWRCFGPGNEEESQPAVCHLLESVVAAINQAPDGSRERRLMLNARIVPRFYHLDEYLNDVVGSRAMILGLRDRGALIVVDECALLHPRLRKAAEKLLEAPRCAVVTYSPCDPALAKTDELLGEGSWLYIAPLVSRFGGTLDPQCELALNSRARLERWLRGTLPALLVEMDGFVPKPSHVSRVAELLADAPPAGAVLPAAP